MQVLCKKLYFYTNNDTLKKTVYILMESTRYELEFFTILKFFSTLRKIRTPDDAKVFEILRRK